MASDLSLINDDDFELKPLPEDSDTEDDIENREEHDYGLEIISLYCTSFDSYNNHLDIIPLLSLNVSLNWFGREIRGVQFVRKFILKDIPQLTKHILLNVINCTDNVIKFKGKLEFTRPGIYKKAKKDFRWERNFNLTLMYTKEPLNFKKIIYENTIKCKKSLFQ